MPQVPVPTDVMPKSVSTAAAAPQIDSRVLGSIGAGGRAMGNAVSAIGEAFGEVLGKVGAAQDNQAEANAKLEWLKGDFAIQQDLQANTGEDGAYLQKGPEMYTELDKRVDEKHRINDPQKRQAYEQWRELNKFGRLKQGVIGYQGAQKNVFLKSHEGETADLEYRITTGNVTPEYVEQFHKGLNEKADGMDRYVLNRADADALKYRTGGRIVRALEEAMLTPGHKLSNPQAAIEFGETVKKLRWELDEIPGAPNKNLNAATRELQLNPQEQALYQRHLQNLSKGGVTSNDGETTSTLKASIVGFDDKSYIIPRVWDGKILSNDEAIERAKAEGIEKFPSYNSKEEALERYRKIHPYMSRDTTERFNRQQVNNQATGRMAVGREIFNYFVDKGLAPHQAAAIAGNMAWEGGGKTDLINPGDNYKHSPGSPHSLGIGQWNDRVPALVAFARKQGIDIPDGNLRSAAYAREVIKSIPLNTQLDFAWNEMQTSERAAGRGVASAGDLRSATAAAIGYHRPAGWTRNNPEAGHGFSSRLGLANQILRNGRGDQAAAAPVGSASDQRYAQAGGTRSDAAPITTGTVPAGQAQAAPAAPEKPADPLGFLGDNSIEDERPLSQAGVDEAGRAEIMKRLGVGPRQPQEDDAEGVGQGSGVTQGYARDLFNDPFERITVGDARKALGRVQAGEPPGDVLGPAAERIFGADRAGQIQDMVRQQGPDISIGDVLHPEEIAALTLRFPELKESGLHEMKVSDALHLLSGAADTEKAGAQQGNSTEGYIPKLNSNEFPRGRLVPGQQFELNINGEKFKLTSDMVNAAGGPDARRLYEKRAKEVNEAAQKSNEDLGKHKWIPKAELDMKNTGQLPEGYRDQLAIMRRVFVKHPEVVENHITRLKIAQQVFRTFQGANQLPFDILRRRVDELAPSPDDPEAVEKTKAFDEAEKRLLKLEGLRKPGTPQFDPVEFFDPNPIVQNAHGIKPVPQIAKLRNDFPGGKKVPENTIQGHELIVKRVDAELAGGVEPEHVRPLSRRETDEFEGNIRASNPREEGFEASIMKTYEAVKKKYGEKYSGMIMKQIMDEVAEKSRKHRDGPDFLKGMESESKINPLTLPGVEELEKFGRQERALEPPKVQRTWGDTARDALRYGGQGVPSTRAIPKTMEELQSLPKPRIFGGEGRGAPIKPTPEKIDELKANPDTLEKWEKDHKMPRGAGLKYLLEKK